MVQREVLRHETGLGVLSGGNQQGGGNGESAHRFDYTFAGEALV
jgi:hypothetical protein